MFLWGNYAVLGAHSRPTCPHSPPDRPFSRPTLFVNLTLAHHPLYGCGRSDGVGLVRFHALTPWNGHLGGLCEKGGHFSQIVPEKLPGRMPPFLADYPRWGLQLSRVPPITLDAVLIGGPRLLTVLLIEDRPQLRERRELDAALGPLCHGRSPLRAVAITIEESYLRSGTSDRALG